MQRTSNTLKQVLPATVANPIGLMRHTVMLHIITTAVSLQGLDSPGVPIVHVLNPAPPLLLLLQLVLCMSAAVVQALSYQMSCLWSGRANWYSRHP